jgi:hypothetical protein
MILLTCSLIVVLLAFVGLLLQGDKSAEETSTCAMIAMLAACALEGYRLLNFIWGL